ncbi:hypothetical protein A5893_11970 [Pedobacter psychrophilus]|uniref:Uncharacterized protein n=1 Tax=Pedobacter psychrophilus TaxID=1826909 RepID=A0A179DCQ3_9SPHI|nr:hypothetical protein [Pedobacter psychrophilus]OAQ38758.1 hypothetical protein A5893_11970 [Pedobacter psychrophilus]
MKSILLKIDDELFEELEDSIKDVKISKTAFIKTAISDAIKSIQRKKLERNLRNEINLIREDKETRAEMKMFEEASLIDLAKFLDDEDDY